jgi:nitroreductase
VDFFEAVKARRSVRSYTPTPITREQRERILDACNLAPSAGNLQAYEIYEVEEADKRAALAQAAYDQDFLKAAPVVLVFCTNPERARRYGERGAGLYSVQDASIAAAYAQLAATTLGLATCWVGAFDEAKVTRALALPATSRPVILIPVGTAAEHPERTPRRELNDLVHRV